MVYRLKDETWATAFALNRSIQAKLKKEVADFSGKQLVCCPYTGTICCSSIGRQVLLSNLTIENNDCKILDFSEVKFQSIVAIHLINKGTQVLVDTDLEYIMYDLAKGRVVKIYSARLKERSSDFTLKYADGTFVDVCNQKEYKTPTLQGPGGNMP
ncbi:unnamed protein product [Bursaphelenchus okinawaensis]|uniref:Uncharacterized protein n=1 Tax=Bursaphelenchus okinawaensis TaxID=465554 RepID=A0A811KPA0_9BILA|nr:unnamed protein product [Bursaphelenchus okinawaensis]CAG9107205.1 unnamed protein product [Bursaphelenchus okinawaensis]